MSHKTKPNRDEFDLVLALRQSKPWADLKAYGEDLQAEMAASASDDDWDDEDPNLEATQAHASSAETSPVNDLLLELITALPRLAVLLSEADEAEFKAAAPRLKAFLALVDAVPREHTPKRTVGFKPPAKKTKAPKAAAKKARKK